MSNDNIPLAILLILTNYSIKLWFQYNMRPSLSTLTA